MKIASVWLQQAGASRVVAGLCVAVIVLAVAYVPTPLIADEGPGDAGSTILCDGHEESLPVAVRVLAIPGLKEGDSSMDGGMNIVDAMFVAQYTVGLREFDSYELACADTNDDGEVNIVDAMHIAQYTVDPSGAGGVLYMPLWDATSDVEMLPPDWAPPGAIQPWVGVQK